MQRLIYASIHGCRGREFVLDVVTTYKAEKSLVKEREVLVVMDLDFIKHPKSSIELQSYGSQSCGLDTSQVDTSEILSGTIVASTHNAAILSEFNIKLSIYDISGVFFRAQGPIT